MSCPHWPTDRFRTPENCTLCVGNYRPGSRTPQPDTEIIRRRTICEACDQWRDGMCQAVRRAGCKAKARKPWTCTQCPEGRWELPVVKPEPITTPSVPVAPLTRFDETNLAPLLPGKRFNASMLAFGDGYIMAYRDGWRGSEIWTVRLDAGLKPIGEPSKLNLHHKDASYGREDPRLFWHKGQLHLAYIGVVGGRRIRHTNQLFARLTADGRGVEDTFSPVDFPAGRRNAKPRRWQKNWQFFDYANHLYAVYTISPHVVVKVDSNDAREVYKIYWSPPWQGGELRGGASPVLIGDEYYCWFHDRIDAGGLVYRVGLYTFDARPPFAPKRVIAEPVLVADVSTKPADQYASVVFPCGAVRRDSDWLVSMGVHDRWTEIHAFDAGEIEAKLVHVRPPVEPVTGDVAVSFLLRQTPCPWRTARKIGHDKQLSELNTTELAKYAAPCLQSAPPQLVLIHDGLPADFPARLAFTTIDPRYYPMDQRWPAAIEWLTANPGIERIWFADVNDCRFTADPFDWLGDTPLAFQQELIAFRDNVWFQKNLPLCPPEYAEFITSTLYPLSCGAWGGTRAAVVEVLQAVASELERLRDWMQRHPPVDPVNLDMLAFNMAARQFSPSTFRADAELQTGPVIHDTQLSRVWYSAHLPLRQNRVTIGG